MFNVTKNPSKANPFITGILLVLALAGVLYFFVDLIGYRVVALIMLLGVSVLAMLFDIYPVLVAAILSALLWNFFFIPPTMTFHIGTPEDTLMFLMYFVVALINAVLTFKIREVERKTRDKAEREKTIQLYNTLLNSLSHELRTPLSAIIGAVDTIKENQGRIPEDGKQDLYKEIEAASYRLNRQVENLLNMSRLEAGVLQPRPDWCDVSDLIYSVLKQIKDDQLLHSVFVKTDENLPLFKTDRGLLEQILLNLIHNAYKYTPDQTTITISVQPVNGNCQIIVTDNGKGFPEHTLEAVFEKFYRLPDSTAGGTGLGLSIAKGFTEALGGTIKLENAPEGGAKFTISIPAETTSINRLN